MALVQIHDNNRDIVGDDGPTDRATSPRLLASSTASATGRSRHYAIALHPLQIPVVRMAVQLGVIRPSQARARRSTNYAWVLRQDHPHSTKVA